MSNYAYHLLGDFLAHHLAHLVVKVDDLLPVYQKDPDREALEYPDPLLACLIHLVVHRKQRVLKLLGLQVEFDGKKAQKDG